MALSPGAKSIIAVVGLGVLVWWLGSGPREPKRSWEK